MDLTGESFHTDDYEQAIETFYERGWTDGLPVVLPTRPLVEAMIAAGGRDRNESLGPMPPKNDPVSIEKLAINAVMGGCRPEYFPVVIASIEAMMAPQHNLNGVIQTTHSCVSLTIVHGPIVQELKFNSRDGVFGNGYRANGAVGRAVRLAIWNIGGAVPWETDMSTMSDPAEWTFCIAEEQLDNPWEPLHVERGCPPGSDAVTVFACESPQSVLCQGTPTEMLFVLGDALSSVSNNNVHTGGETLVVLNPRIAQEFHEQGWSKNRVRQYLWENARRSHADLRAGGVHAVEQRQSLTDMGRIKRIENIDSPDVMIPICDKPQDIHVVVAGGRTYFAAVLPGWGAYGGYASTQLIRRPRKGA